MTIRKGDRVRYRDAFGQWHDGEALSDVEGIHGIDPETGRHRKIHDFPVIWVSTRNGRVPWPVGDVELAEAVSGS